MRRIVACTDSLASAVFLQKQQQPTDDGGSPRLERIGKSRRSPARKNQSSNNICKPHHRAEAASERSWVKHQPVNGVEYLYVLVRQPETDALVVTGV